MKNIRGVGDRKPLAIKVKAGLDWKGDGWKQGWGFGVGRGELLTEAV